MFGTQKRLPSDFRILQRRREEETRSKLTSHVQAEFNARTLAQWEDKTNKKIEHTQVK